MPPALLSFLSSLPAVGFSGSRAAGPASLACAAFCAAFSAVRPLVPVFVGCAAGVDRAAFYALSPVPFARPAAGGRVAIGRVQLFAVSPAGAFGPARGRAAFAARSLAFVAALRAAGGCLVSFPGSSCPPGLSPASSFSGSGSGSWATVCAALGSGVAVLLWSPGGLSVPFSVGLRFSPFPAAPGWFFAPAPAAQPTLF